MDTLLSNWPMIVALLFVISLIFTGLFTVDTAEVAIVTRFGKFLRLAQPGLNFKVPFIDGIADTVSTKVEQIDIKMETKTKDNVFVSIPISIQTRINDAQKAFYELSDPKQQIKAYVEPVILNHVPGMDLDEVFRSTATIVAAVKTELEKDLGSYGYTIVNVLVTDIIPDAKVKSAMNDINAAQREQVAAQARAEANKILLVKNAEGEAEAKEWQGKGIANERKAIAEGLKNSIEQVKDALGDNVSSEDVLSILMLTQYFDTLKAIGQTQGTNTLFLNHSPGSMTDLFQQIQSAVATGKKADA